ncbi:uncharacterized protein BX663DRAFT_427304 [Cokeromyces recurvatus]|uniref:uncharacterized protein n=1 Tax=Cokeromyces recurvatus TaxID=90255 RepID=UPI00221EAE87|nr:uncharacterized protein BX663DRAFT_427304 [Cokeromyces recurvatus]KAI7906384.1 hypothetical protein BX663DRAFT_427304 [Cokeromyces recurvatus]
MSGIEVVYTIHKFEAENPDEISINVGEKVIVLERDEGFNDGWWQGKNERGEIGLFPITYTTNQLPIITSPIALENKIDSLESTISKMKPPIQQKNSTQHSSLISAVSMSSKNVHSIISKSLENPLLSNKPIEDWSSEEVAIWLIHIGFDKELAENFKNQEISGDILLELTLDSLKELQIATFGKRFKIHNAINALRQEANTRNNNKRSDIVYKQQQEFLEDDLVSNYSTIIRNSQLKNRHSSYIQQRNSSSDIHANRTSTLQNNSSSSVERKRNTINNIEQANRYNFIQSPSTMNQLQNVLSIHSPATRQSEEVASYSDIPDMEGWLYKQGDKYKNWNKRWFVLKAYNLYYFKNPKSPHIRGIINLKGYRIESDENIHAGKYCFMAYHEKERTFYFYTDSEKSMKAWMKALMKATITRNYTSPVMSSNTISTVSLEMARKMRPRPPSTLFQEQNNVFQQFSAEEEMKMMMMKTADGARTSSILSTNSNLLHYPQQPKSITTLLSSDHTSSDNYSIESSVYNSRLKDSGFNSIHGNSRRRSLAEGSSSSQSSLSYKNKFIKTPKPTNNTTYCYPNEEDEDLIDPEHMTIIESNRHLLQKKEDDLSDHSKRYIQWINKYIQRNNKKIHHLSELSTGDILLDFLEQLTQKEIERHMAMPGRSANDKKMDLIIAAFKFMTLEGVELDGVCTIRGKFNYHHY